MRELTLKELQDIGFDILRDVHDFCVKNNIKYSLAYGTLIGAIRHKGFIPWDDDVDIIMPRLDYERFCATYESDKFKVSSFEVDPECRMTFGRVYDDVLTVVKNYIPWSTKEHGASIDIFPVDAVEDDYDAFVKRSKKTIKVFKFMQLQRKALLNFSSYLSAKSTYHLIIKKLVLCNGIFVPFFINKIIKDGTKYKYQSTNHWGSTVFFDSYSMKDYHENILFDDVIDVEFEHFQFKALKGYDQYLRNIYGDYMKLPPEEERISLHTHVHVYWKNT